MTRPFRRQVLSMFALALTASALPALAHEFSHGGIVVEHPYALPTAAGERIGAVYFRALHNHSAQADRLVAVQTEACERVEIQAREGSAAAPSWHAVPALELAAGAELKPRHDGKLRLALIGLKAPLEDGQRLVLHLRFERAGEIEATAWVQTPRARAARP